MLKDPEPAMPSDDDEEGEDGAPVGSDADDNLLKDRDAVEISVKERFLPPSLTTPCSLCKVNEVLVYLDKKGVLSLLHWSTCTVRVHCALQSQRKAATKINGYVARLNESLVLAVSGSTATIWDVMFGVQYSDKIDLGDELRSLSYYPVELGSESPSSRFKVYAESKKRSIVSIELDQDIEETTLAYAVEMSNKIRRKSDSVLSNLSSSANGFCIDAHDMIASSAQANSVGSSSRNVVSRTLDKEMQFAEEIILSLSLEDQKDALERLQYIVNETRASRPVSERTVCLCIARALLGVLDASRRKEARIYLRKWCSLISKSLKTGGVSYKSITEQMQLLRQQVRRSGMETNIVNILTQDVGREVVLEQIMDKVGDLSASDYVRILQYAMRCNHNHLMEKVISTSVGEQELRQALRSIPMQDVWILVQFCITKLKDQMKGAGSSRGTQSNDGSARRSRQREANSQTTLESGVLLWAQCAIDARFASLILDEGQGPVKGGGIESLLKITHRVKQIYEQSADLLGLVTHIEDRNGIPKGGYHPNYVVERLKLPVLQR